MNKLLITVCSLALIACTNNADLRPDSYSKGERLLANGVINYKNDKFSAAQQNFHRALLLYQSIDNSKGVQLARINLVETLLALNNFGAAEEQLAILKQQKMSGMINDPFKDRIILLEVRLLFKNQKYHESLAIIEPLLLQLETQEINDNKQLELLATAARLEALITVETESRWVRKFRRVLSEETKFHPKFQVILKRIDAIIATQNQQYQEALNLLHEVLSYYQGQADRRAIATCLEEIAEIELKQHNKAQGLEYLKRALTIHVWLKDQYHIDKIQKRIIQVNQSP